jgi:hypothetical protein
MIVRRSRVRAGTRRVRRVQLAGRRGSRQSAVAEVANVRVRDAISNPLAGPRASEVAWASGRPLGPFRIRGWPYLPGEGAASL